MREHERFELRLKLAQLTTAAVKARVSERYTRSVTNLANNFEMPASATSLAYDVVVQGVTAYVATRVAEAMEWDRAQGTPPHPVADNGKGNVIGDVRRLITRLERFCAELPAHAEKLATEIQAEMDANLALTEDES